MTVFLQAFAIIVGTEGGYSSNSADPGNWTGGKRGAGECKGTCWGISAASYPHLSIATLTLEQAQEIYHTDYWQKIHAADLPPALALLAFDSAVNNGVGQAVRWLQTIAGAATDGAMGPVTLAKVRALVKKDGLDAVCAEYLAQRLMFTAGLPSWRTFGLGWARRLCRLPYQARSMTETV
jgi:lysozyme family protein